MHKPVRLSMGSVLAGLLVACGQPSALATQSTSPALSPATPAPSVPTATPTPSATASSTSTPAATSLPALAAVDFTCRLPLVRTVGQTSQAGFVSFPGGAFSPDPAGNLTSKSWGLAYDRIARQWLPVDWRSVSDDGLHYAYVVLPADNPGPGLDSSIHVVDVTTGRDRVVLNSGQYVIVDYTAGGIYLTAWVGGHDGPGPQVGWLLDPGSGAVRALNGGAKYGYWIGGGAGWRTDYNPADPTVHQGMTGPNRLIRVDLNTGSETQWFYQQGADAVQVLGFDRQGRPIIASIVGSAWTVFLLDTAGNPSELFSTSDYWNAATADSHGIWVTSSNGTYLYDAAHGLRRVSSAFGQIAGGCH